MAKKKENKIAVDDHQKLQQYINATKQLVSEIGGIEVQKQNAINQHGVIQEQFKKFSEGLEHKYGKVSIDVDTGIYKTPEELEAEKAAEEKKAAAAAKKNGANKKN